MKRQGLTLVEIIVALAIFSIIMLAISGTIVSGLKLRKSNALESQALTYAASVLEQYKSFWSDFENYQCYDPDNPSGLSHNPKCTEDIGQSFWPAIPPVPAAFRDDLINITVACIERDGDVMSNAACTAPGFIPELRRVSVTITDLQNKTRASLMTEIGNPK
jgi:prepilin-type N-terminal cleavage/methylation domain-containing protein